MKRRLDVETVDTIKKFIAAEYWNRGFDTATDPFFLASDSVSRLLKNDLCTLLSQLLLLGLVPLQRDGTLESHMGSVAARFDAPRAAVVKMAQLLFKIQESLKQGRARRSALGYAELNGLMDRCERRCSICRFEFSEHAVDAFYRSVRFDGRVMYSTYDVLKPARERGRDLEVHVDHIQPISFLGTNDLANLQLLCSYCNSVKREYLTIFDRLGQVVRHAAEAPHPFAVLRLLSREGCELCGTSGRGQELTVFPKDPTMPPSLENLGICCYVHDSFPKRWVPVR